MFSGIIETSVPLLEKTQGDHVVRISLTRPKNFTDIKVGDSIAVNGICLTVESFDQQKMNFTLGQETLKVLAPAEKTYWSRELNLERSLQVGDRLHGHFVQGHVDTITEVTRLDSSTESWVVGIKIPEGFAPYVWRKGSVALNGVSLTVNAVENGEFEVCLIPETISRTNLKFLKVGDALTFEVDFFARGVVETLKNVKGQS